MPNFDTEN